jgi:GAF domain-containing protein
MSFFQQLINYLSQPPDSMVYHIVTLLALQATFGLAWWQIRRRPDDKFARRLAWATGAILVSRLFILLALFATSGLIEAVAVLPPLERAVDTLTVALLVWALAPQPRNLPYLNTALLLIVTIVITFLYFAFAAEWRNLVQSGDPHESYAGSTQALFWRILQMSLLALGSVVVLITREDQWSLRLAIFGVLFVAQGFGLVFGASLGPPNIEISFWNRVGNIVAFPMLTVLAYRHNLHHLLPASHLGRSVVNKLTDSLSLSKNVSSSLKPDQTLEDSLKMVSGLLPAPFIGVVLIDDNWPQHFNVTAIVNDYAVQTAETLPETRSWVFQDTDWPSFLTALRERKSVVLVSDGPGARQLHELSSELNLGRPNALLIEPLIADSIEIGLLLLSAETWQSRWSDEEKTLAKTLATFLAHSLYNAQRYQLALAGQAPDFERERTTLVTELEQVTQQRDQALERVGELGDQLALARERLDGDHRKLRETTQALAMAVRRQTRVRQLEDEVASLREALSEAELALAYAAAGEAGLSTEWVMRTVTRYSGELEEAQARIISLEEQSMLSDGRETLEQAAKLTSKLRTPLTALGGYTDLLLEKETGKISSQQESLLRRMRVNVDNMTNTVEALSTTARLGHYVQAGEVRLDVHEAIEEAILAVSPKLQTNKLRVDISLQDGVPIVLRSSDGVQQLLAEAINAACLVSVPDGRLQIHAQRLPVNATTDDSSEQAGYLRVSIRDCGGDHSHNLYATAILEKNSANSDRNSSDISDLAGILDKIALMISAQGGRSWLDLTQEPGSTLFLLLPVPDDSSVLGGTN